jgi:pimeloyl-ACP methyl ester carboxylesterase
MLKEFSFKRSSGQQISGKYLSITPELITEYKKGLDILFIHAFPLSSDMFVENFNDSNLISKLHEKANELGRIRIILPDSPGFGGSSAFSSDPQNLQPYVEVIGDVIDYFQINEFVIGGVSMGGYISLEFIRKYSGITSGLILVDTRVEADNIEQKEGRITNAQKIKTALKVYMDSDSFTPVDRLISKSEDIKEYINGLLDKLIAKNSQGELRGKITLLIEKQIAYSVAQALFGMAGRSDTSEVLATFQKPVLVIVGEEDVLTPVELSEKIHELAPNSTLNVVKDAGHLSNWEKVAEFNKIFLSWISNL